MKRSDDCPGRMKCHGAASWCDDCGDVDLVCDDPQCEVHARGHERREREKITREQFISAASVCEEKRKAWMIAQEELRRYENGNAVMVARES